MGVGVSNWRLARSVSQLGQLGVVSSALLAVVFARRLQAGDLDGRMRHALDAFPFRNVAERVIEAYHIPEGKGAANSFTGCAMPTIRPGAGLVDLMVTANFAEVFLAKEGHPGIVGINLLEKIQMASLPSLYGAMLAGVDYVLMGAGIPRSIPGVLDHYARGEAAQLRIDVDGALPGEEFLSTFDPSVFAGQPAAPLKRPQFLAIVSSSTLATSLVRKSNGKVDGFVIEGDTAGGHNAPPRGPLTLTEAGEPIYGARDIPDLSAFRSLGLPFWLAGSKASPERLAEARAAGAAGIQLGTAFAFCDESGIEPELKRKICSQARTGSHSVFTDPLASPTGFPFKVLQIDASLSSESVYTARERVCDLGYLRQAYRKPDGKLGYRCAAEPVDDFVAKGGAHADTVGRKCLCNGLAATVGQAQLRSEGRVEPTIITTGNDIARLARFLPPDSDHYSAASVIEYLLSSPATA